MRRDLHLQPIFLVERYLPGLTEATAISLATRLETASRALRAEGPSARWLGSTVLLYEETTFCAFRARSTDAVQALNEHASAPYERIVEALNIKARSTHRLP
jgi:hypothetical protein